MKTSLVICFILLSMFLFSQEYGKENNYLDKSFEYSRIDTAFIFDRVERIRYIDQTNNSEFYIKFYDNDGIIETGHLKQGIYSGLWSKYDSEGNIIKSLNFDTLLIQADDILRIANDEKFDVEVYNIDFEFESNKEWDGNSLENHWIISRNIFSKASNSRETIGISVCAISGKKERYGFVIMEQPAWPNYDTPPKFDEKFGSLDEFLIKNAQYPISEKSKSDNAVIVSFDINKMGELQNISTFRANTGFYKREALRLVELMPNWLPAKLNGKAVDSSHHEISINFQ